MSANTVPGRTTILVSSWVFIFASIFLLAEFLAINKKVSPNACNWLGTISDAGWFLGFALLVDWLVFHIFPAYGASRRALTGATLKLIASCFFLVQPLAGLIAPTYGAAAGAIGVPWSNFVGIMFFHSGNCVDAVGMAFSFDRTKPLAWANWPALGMFIYVSATWLLVFANGIFLFGVIPAPWGPQFDLGNGPQYVEALQYGGASLLLAGSVVYTAWAADAVDANAKTAPGTMTAPLAPGGLEP